VNITAAHAAFLLPSQAARVGRRHDGCDRETAADPVARQRAVDATAAHEAWAEEMAQQSIPSRDRRVFRRRKHSGAESGLTTCSCANGGATNEESA